MFEVIGVIALTLVALGVIAFCVSMAFVYVAFSDTSKISSYAPSILMVAVALSAGYGWWELAGTKIHMSFG